MPTSDERQRLRDAMERLLAGKPIRSNGALTIVCLAEEAGLKRHLLTHRHTDLRDEFYARVKAQGKIPDSELALRARIAELTDVVAKLRVDNRALVGQVTSLRRMNNVLAVENLGRRTAPNQPASNTVRPLRP